MPAYTQSGRLISCAVQGLDKDALLLEAVTGQEQLSSLYEFELDLLAEAETDISFEKILGQPISITVHGPDDLIRYFHGIVNRFSQGAEVRGASSDMAVFVKYRATVVPALWLLTRRVQSRIFQQMTIPEILTAVLTWLDVQFDLKGQYDSRDYCVQYRESDFAFASRLMEEEGIFYYFRHAEDAHTLVVSDHPAGHADVIDPATLFYETVTVGNVRADRIYTWEKRQEIRSGQVTLWDHCFEAAHQNLEAQATLPDAVDVGTVSHKLKAGGGDKLEVYDYPGEYAKRFDGVDPGGSDRPADIERIFQDNERTTRVRMEQEAVDTLLIYAESACRQVSAGHTFTLDRHFNANGKYVLTQVDHQIRIGDVYRSGSGTAEYSNTFKCIPVGLPFRPARTTPRPVITGTQTAEVVGLAGQEIFTDKYGRVKLQFFWDREGKRDEQSSCWVRVSQIHAGRNWGGIDVPRIGEEVIVAFEDGDPDRPIVVGRVYNAREMPPFGLPKAGMVSGMKSNSTPGGGGSNEISLDDTKGNERMYVHAQFNQDEVVENDQTSHVKNKRTKTVDVDETTTIGNNRTESVGTNHTEKIGADRILTVGANETISIAANHSNTVGANHTESIGSNMSLTVGGQKTETVALASTETVGIAKTVTVGAAYSLSVGAVMGTTVAASSSLSVGSSSTVSVGGAMTVTVAKDLTETIGAAATQKVKTKKLIDVGDELQLVCGSSKILLKKDGTILIEGKDITIKGSGKITAKASGNMVLKGSKIGQN